MRREEASWLPHLRHEAEFGRLGGDGTAETAHDCCPRISERLGLKITAPCSDTIIVIVIA